MTGLPGQVPQLGGAAHRPRPGTGGGAQASREGAEPTLAPGLAPGLDKITNGGTGPAFAAHSAAVEARRTRLPAGCLLGTGCNLLQVCSQRPPAPGLRPRLQTLRLPPGLQWWSSRRAKSRGVRGEGGEATSI